MAAKVGFVLTFPPYPVSFLWPPNAVLLATLLRAPRRLWGVLLLAAFPAHLVVELESGVPILMILCWFVSNASEAVLGAVCVHRFAGGPPWFDSLRPVSAFLASAVLATFVTTFLDAAFVRLIGWGEAGYWTVWSVRFFSNVLAMLTLIPVLVTLGTSGVPRRQRATHWHLVEAGLFVAGLLTTGLIAFGNQSHHLGIIPALVYVPLPFLLWAAVRFGPSSVSASLLALALLAIWNAMHGRGPFTAMSPAENVLSLQIFLIVMTVPLLLLAAVLQERRETEQALRESQQRYALATAAGGVGVWESNLETEEVYTDSTIRKMLGYAPSECWPQSAWLHCVHPDDVARVTAGMQATLEGEASACDMEYRVLQKDGRIRWLHVRWAVRWEGDGRPRRLIGTAVDVTERKQAEERLRTSEEVLRESHARIRDLAGRLLTAQEEERKRIARDLHDDLSQQLGALSIDLFLLTRQLHAPADPLHGQILGLQNRITEIIDWIRNLSHDLHSAVLDHLGLSAALEFICTEFRQQEGMHLTLETRGDLATIPADIGLCVYRVVQEALRNIAKHAGATRAAAMLTNTGAALDLCVTDNGVGFDPERVRWHSGLGLVSMEERIKLLQGSLHITTQAGRGTELRVRIPLDSIL
jgi:PAS domain S-box-containing protein